MDMKGEEIAQLLYVWLDERRMHPDEFEILFAGELMELLHSDKENDNKSIARRLRE